MHPLDLLKVKFQVATEKPKGGLGGQIWNALKEVKTNEGWRGLYRGVGPNIAGNASSWGLYFLLCVRSTCSRMILSDSDSPATICSRLAPPVMTRPTRCQQGLTFCILHKQVRNAPGPSSPLSDTPHPGAVTAIMTNPIWVVKVRMFTTRADNPHAYKNLWSTCTPYCH